MAGQTAVLKPTNGFRDKFERYIARDRLNPHLRRKAYTAIAAKMARTVHAVIKHGEPYRPFSRGRAQAEGPLSIEPWRREPTSQIMFGLSAWDFGSRLKDGEGRIGAYPVFAMGETTS